LGGEEQTGRNAPSLRAFMEYLQGEALTREQMDAVLAPGNVIVEAGAGTGKTKTLVARYLYHVLVEGFYPSQVVALTFTEKAAQEMRERVVQELARFLETPLRERAFRAMEGMIHAPVKTFHGFAAYILREYPVETGVDPAFTVLDEMGEGLLLEEAINAFISAHLDAPHLSLLLSHWNIFQLKRALRIFFRSVLSENHWHQLEASLPWDLSSQDMPPEVERIREMVSLKGEVEKFLAQGKYGDFFSRVHSSLEMLEYLLSSLPGDDPVSLLIRVARELDAFPSWGRRTLLKELEAIKGWSYSLWEWLEARLGGEFYRAFLEVARGVEETFGVMKAREGVLTFSDLQRGLVGGLRGSRVLVEELRGRFRRVLVDEYQDTNELQREVVCRLSERRGEWAPRYDEVHLEEGKLFIVGDPKQSIYAFRGGDVAVYARTKAQLGEGSSLFLTRSFRSGSTLVDTLNALFPRIFQPDIPLPQGYAVPFTPLTTPREGGEVWLWEVDRGEGYLEAVARLVLGIRERRGPWGDMALLVRRNATAVELYRYLSSLDVPVVSSTTGPLEECREVQDLLLYLKALDNPADDYSIAGVLLGPFVGVGPSTLLSLSSRGGGLYGAWREVVSDSRLQVGSFNVSREDLDALAQGFEVFQTLLVKKDRLTISSLIQEVVRATGYGAWLVCQPYGDQALANLDRLARVARRFQKGRLFTLSEFLIYIDHWGLSAREVQEGVEGGEAVAILTVHAAKGLEFPVVVLVETWAQFKRNTDPVLYDPQEGFALRIPGLDLSPRYDRVRSMKDAKGREEEKRLLYVALTRAKEELHILLRSDRPRGYTWHGLLKEGGVESLALKGDWKGLPSPTPQEASFGGRRGTLEPPISLEQEEGLQVGVRRLLGDSEGDDGGLGALLHRAMKEISHPRDAPRWYELHSPSFHGTSISKGGFVRLVKTYFSSALYREVVSKALQVYRELPLEAYYKSMKVKGRPDLLAVMGDGSLVLVEYKLSSSMLYRGTYRDQLAIYSWLVEKYSGRWPREAFLYSITTGEEERVEGTSLRNRALVLLEEGYIKLSGGTQGEVEKDQGLR